MKEEEKQIQVTLDSSVAKEVCALIWAYGESIAAGAPIPYSKESGKKLRIAFLAIEEALGVKSMRQGYIDAINRKKKP